MKILVTNDDGIFSPGLYALKQALERTSQVAVIAPDKNRSAIGRGITIGESLDVQEVSFPDGSMGYSVDGTPVDCVRLASLGFLEWRPDIVVSGINLGPNLGDDITYSGTVAAAFEGIMLELPPSPSPSSGPAAGKPWAMRALFTSIPSLPLRRSWRRSSSTTACPDRVLLNINSPNLTADRIRGAAVTRLGKRIYRDQLVEQDPGANGGKRYKIYGDDPSYHEEEGTDFHALSEDRISVTPIHFALTNLAGMELIRNLGLDALLDNDHEAG